MFLASSALLACNTDWTRDDSESAKSKKAAPAKPGEKKKKAEIDEMAGKPTPHTHYDERVTIVGEIGEVHSDRAFAFESDSSIFEDEVLVLSKSGVSLSRTELEEDVDLVVAGTVRRLEDVKDDLGWTLDPELGTKWEERPVLMVEEIREIEETARWTAGDGEEPDTMLVGMWSLYMAPDPRDLAGFAVEIDAVPVRAMAPEGLWIGPNERNQTFVAAPQGKPMEDVQVDDTVRIEGTVQTMPPADTAISRFGFAEDMRDQLAEQMMYIDAAKIEKLAPEVEPKKGAVLHRPSQ